MKPLTPREQEYWQAYLESLPADRRPAADVHVEAGFAGNAAITDELLQLYLSGRKTAGSGLVEDFTSAGDPLPQPGNHWLYLDGQSRPRAILRTEKVVVHKFKDVPPEIAVAEGEGDLSLAYWRRVHAELYAPHLAAWGVADLNEAHVVTEFFTLVHRD